MKKLITIILILLGLTVYSQQETINIGISPNDGTGDKLRTAFTKCNDNFDELYLTKSEFEDLVNKLATDTLILGLDTITKITGDTLIVNRDTFLIGVVVPSLWNSTNDYIYPTTLTDSVGIGLNDPNNLFQVKSLINFNPTYYLTSVGYMTGDSITSGEKNSIFGYQAGVRNKSGNDNSFFGYQSGYSSETNRGNSFFGYQSGYSNSGDYCTLFGYQVGYNNTIDNRLMIDNTNTDTPLIDGYFDIDYLEINGRLRVDSHTVINDTVVINQLQFGNGLDNILIGALTGTNITTGFTNIMIGVEAGEANTTGAGAIMIGYRAGETNTNLDNNIFIGYQAGRTNTGNVTTAIGNRAGNGQSGNNNVFLGYESGSAMSGAGASNTFVGTQSGYNLTGGSNNVGVGTACGYDIRVGSQNVFVGHSAGNSLNGSGDNVMIGYRSGLGTTTGNNNVFLGSDVALNNLTGSGNVYIGFQNGNSATGSNNVFLGNAVGQNETGSNLLYIDNSNTTKPLIYGDFAANEIGINGDLYTDTSRTGIKNWGNTWHLVDSVLSSDTTYLSALPGGYVIDHIIFENTTSNLITGVNIGFTSGGGEIAATGNILANDIGSFTLIQELDAKVDDDIYVTASNWNSGNIIIRIYMEKLY